MKLKNSVLPLCTAFLGVVGTIFRFWLRTAGTDAEGLVITNHPANVAMMVLLVLFGIVLAVCSYFMDKTPTAPGRSMVGAVGCYIGALGLLITAISELIAMPTGQEEMTITALASVLSIVFGFAGVVVLIVMGNCRRKGTTLNVLYYAVIVAFFVFHLLQQYRVWTTQPQLSYYLFPLVASISLMLTVYHRACKDLNQPAQWQYLVFSQTALFFSMMSMGGQSRVFYISMAAWTLLDSIPGKEVK